MRQPGRERSTDSRSSAHLSGLITSFRAGPEAWPAGFVIGAERPTDRVHRATGCRIKFRLRIDAPLATRCDVFVEELQTMTLALKGVRCQRSISCRAEPMHA